MALRLAKLMASWPVSAPVFRDASRKFLFLVLLALVALGSSCSRRPLEEEWEPYAYAEILLVTDWQQLLPYEKPTGLTAIFYSADGGNPVTVMSNNTEQNAVRLARGRYDVLIFNQSIYEFGSMSFTGMDAFETATANLNPLTAGNTLTAADYKWLSQVLHTPDSIALGMREPEYFHADRFQYEVTDELCMRQYYKENGIAGIDAPVWDIPDPVEYVDTIFSTPPPVPPTLNAKVYVKGINNAFQVRAYITNMARADRFGPHTNTEEPAIHVISNWTINPSPDDKTRGTFEASVRCFGVPTMQVQEHEMELQKYEGRATTPITPTTHTGTASLEPARLPSSRVITAEDYGRNILFLEVLLKDGKTHSTFVFDVTDYISYAENLLRLDLVLNIDDYPGCGGGPDDYPVILPDVPDVIGAGGAGFDATVEDWKHEDHTIKF